MAGEFKTAADVIMKALDAAQAAKDTNKMVQLRKELTAAASIRTQGGLARELDVAIQEGPDAVDKVMKRYGYAVTSKRENE